MSGENGAPQLRLRLTFGPATAEMVSDDLMGTPSTFLCLQTAHLYLLLISTSNILTRLIIS